jgi:hypothetical protein
MSALHDASAHEGAASKTAEVPRDATPPAQTSSSGQRSAKAGGNKLDYGTGCVCCSRAMQFIQFIWLLLVFCSGAAQMGWAVGMLVSTKYCVHDQLDGSCDASGLLAATVHYPEPACFTLSDALVQGGASDMHMKLSVRITQDCPVSVAAITTAQGVSTACTSASAAAGDFGALCKLHADSDASVVVEGDSVNEPGWTTVYADSTRWVHDYFSFGRMTEYSISLMLTLMIIKPKTFPSKLFRCYAFTGGGFPLSNQVVHIMAGMMGLLTGVISGIILAYQIAGALVPSGGKSGGDDGEENSEGGADGGAFIFSFCNMTEYSTLI